MRVDFRAASAHDIPELAAVKIASWRSAYASFVLAKSLDGLSIERELPEFERRFARSDVAGFVAQIDARIESRLNEALSGLLGEERAQPRGTEES